jgi:outer membrane lipoprotein-sorting protein
VRRGNAHAGTVEIRFSEYQLNTGLSDDLFSAESRQP